MNRLAVTEHHGKSEVVRVDIDADEKTSIVVEHLSSRKCIVVDFVYHESEGRVRMGQYYYE